MGTEFSDYLTVKQFAEFTGLNRNTIYHRIHNGTLEYGWQFDTLIIPRTEVLKYRKEKYDIEKKYMWVEDYCERKGIDRGYFYKHKSEYDTKQFGGRLYVRVKK